MSKEIDTSRKQYRNAKSRAIMDILKELKSWADKKAYEYTNLMDEYNGHDTTVIRVYAARVSAYEDMLLHIEDLLSAVKRDELPY